MLRKDDQVLLLRRFNTGYQDGKYGLVAGHLDGDELARDAMVREAKEEAGITVNADDLDFLHVVHRLSRGESGQERVDLFYEASKWQGEVTNMEPNKCDDLSWFPIDNLPDNILPLVGRVIADISRGVNYSEYSQEPI